MIFGAAETFHKEVVMMRTHRKLMNSAPSPQKHPYEQLRNADNMGARQIEFLQNVTTQRKIANWLGDDEDACAVNDGLAWRVCDRCGFIRELPRGPLRICDPCNEKMGFPTHAQRSHDAETRAIVQDAQKPLKVFDKPPSLKVRVMMAWFRLARKMGLV